MLHWHIYTPLNGELHAFNPISKEIMAQSQKKMDSLAKAMTLAKLVFGPKISKARDIYNGNKVEQGEVDHKRLITIVGLSMTLLMCILSLAVSIGHLLPLGAMAIDARCELLHDKWGIGAGDGCRVEFQTLELSSLPAEDWSPILRIYSRKLAGRENLSSEDYDDRRPAAVQPLEYRYSQAKPGDLLAINSEEFEGLREAVQTFRRKTQQARDKEGEAALLTIILKSIKDNADARQSWLDASTRIRSAMAQQSQEPPFILRPRRFAITPGNMTRLARIQMDDIAASREEKAASRIAREEDASPTLVIALIFAVISTLAAMAIAPSVATFFTTISRQGNALYSVHQYFLLQKTPQPRSPKRKNPSRL